MAVKEFLYYVQDGDGREIVSVQAKVERVSDVTADYLALLYGRAHVRLFVNGKSFREARVDRRDLTLYRVPADDKLAKPVAHKLKESKP